MALCNQCAPLLDVGTVSGLQTLAEFIAFMCILVYLLRDIQKHGTKHFKAGLAVFYILWAFILQETFAFFLGTYTLYALFAFKTLVAMEGITPHIIKVVMLMVAFLPGLIIVNIIFFYYVKYLRARLK